MRIAIVDDKKLNRDSLADKIVYSGEADVIFTAENGQDFLSKMSVCSNENVPQIVLMDIEMPVLDGIEAVRQAKEKFPSTEFLMLTVFDDEENIFEAIKAGASGYLLKDESVEMIMSSLKQILEFGAVPMSPLIARKAMRIMLNKHEETSANNPEDSQSELSAREMEVLKGMVDGLDYREIAERHFVSPHTVRKHIANIYGKLHVKSKVAAVKVALKKRWF